MIKHKLSGLVVLVWSSVIWAGGCVSTLAQVRPVDQPMTLPCTVKRVIPTSLASSAQRHRVGESPTLVLPNKSVPALPLVNNQMAVSEDSKQVEVVDSFVNLRVVASPAKLVVDQDPYAKLKKELIIERMGDDGWRHPLTGAERATVLSKLHLIPGIEEFLRPNRFVRNVSKILILNLKTNGQLKDLSKTLDNPAKGYSTHLNYVYVGDDPAKQNVMLVNRKIQVLFDINGGILE